jgi:hypothetical protein
MSGHAARSSRAPRRDPASGTRRRAVAPRHAWSRAPRPPTAQQNTVNTWRKWSARSTPSTRGRPGRAERGPAANTTPRRTLRMSGARCALRRRSARRTPIAAEREGASREEGGEVHGRKARAGTGSGLRVGGEKGRPPRGGGRGRRPSSDPLRSSASAGEHAHDQRDHGQRHQHARLAFARRPGSALVPGRGCRPDRPSAA